MNKPRNIVAVISMLHEAAGRSSADRRFRDRPVLAWTLERLGRAKCVSGAVVVCWEDQREAVEAIGAARIFCPGQRTALPSLDALSAARRWADGWRGGLLGSCAFDAGFHGPSIAAAVADNFASADAVILVDPAAALVDGRLLEALAEQPRHAPAEQEFFFAPAAPGLAGAMLGRSLLKQLAAAQTYPGRYLGYLPDSPRPDPISQGGCAPVTARAVRTVHRFTLDSQRQIARIETATAALNGQLLGISAEELVHRVEKSEFPEILPREVVVELTVKRETQAIFRAGTHINVQRGDLSLEDARRLFAQMAEADDARLTLAGSGDPLLSPVFFDCVAAAAQAGIRAIHVQTDLLGIDAAQIDALAALPLDVISIDIPAITGATYQAVMGVDGCTRVLNNVRILIERRLARGKATPLLVPIFTKCRANLGEMESWYDQWLKLAGSAVIAGPSDWAGQIPDCGVADMTPPKRRPCARLANRLTVLSDGSVAACEEDVCGRQTLGNIRQRSLGEIWTTSMSEFRAGQAREDWNNRPLCAACRQWHRP